MFAVYRRPKAPGAQVLHTFVGPDDIRVLVLFEADYLNLINGYAAKALYDSGHLTRTTAWRPATRPKRRELGTSGAHY